MGGNKNRRDISETSNFSTSLELKNCKGNNHGGGKDNDDDQRIDNIKKAQSKVSAKGEQKVAENTPF